MSRTRLSLAAMFPLLFCLGALSLQAQDGRGKIVGRVTDPSGAVISQVEVKARNIATDVVVTTRSNEAGNYTIPYLLPGFYTFYA